MGGNYPQSSMITVARPRNDINAKFQFSTAAVMENKRGMVIAPLDPNDIGLRDPGSYQFQFDRTRGSQT